MSQPPAAPHPVPNGAAPTGDGIPSRRAPWPPDPFAYLDGRLCVGWMPLDEVVATTGLLLVIHGCVRSGRSNVVAVAVGVWIGGAYFFTSSTSFANPAVTVARTLSDSFAGIAPSSTPMFITMQLAGAAVALVLIRFLFATNVAADPEPVT